MDSNYTRLWIWELNILDNFFLKLEKVDACDLRAWVFLKCLFHSESVYWNSFKIKNKPQQSADFKFISRNADSYNLMSSIDREFFLLNYLNRILAAVALFKRKPNFSVSTTWIRFFIYKQIQLKINNLTFQSDPNRKLSVHLCTTYTPKVFVIVYFCRISTG